MASPIVVYLLVADYDYPSWPTNSECSRSTTFQKIGDSLRAISGSSSPVVSITVSQMLNV